MIVLDSGFLVASHNQRDVHRGAAATTMEKLIAGEWSPALFPECVVLEMIAVLLARRARCRRAGCSDPAPGPRPRVRSVLGHVPQRQGRLSVVDTAIVTLARTRAARFVATFDRNFRQVEEVAVVPA